jgi:site-specific recombinase XerD
MGGMKMLTDIWIESVWKVLNVKPNTLKEYKRLYKRNLQPLIGHRELDLVEAVELQTNLMQLTPQVARHSLMLLKTIYREANLYKVSSTNPTVGLRTPPIRFEPKKFLTWEEINKLDWGKYNNQRHKRRVCFHI